MIPQQEMLRGGAGASQQPQEAPVAGPNQPMPLFELGPFKGLDLWRSPLQMQDQYLTDMSMMVLDEVLGAITDAAGRVSLFINAGLTMPILGMDVLRPANPSPNAIPYLFTVTGSGTVWQIDFVNGINQLQVSLPETWSSTAQTFMASLNHVMLFCNGTNPPIKIRDDWSPTAPAAQLAGVAGPTNILTATDSTVAGNLNGAYRWRYTFQNGQPFGGESSPSAASDQPGALSLSNHSAILTNIQTSSDPQVTLVNIYRLGGSIPEWRFVASVPNGTTTYTDNINDLNLGQLLVLDRSLPPTGLTQIVPHKNRLFGFIGNTLYFTLYNEPESWPILFQLPVGDNSPIVAIGTASGSVLFIWKQRETWVLGGDSIANFNLLRLWGVGCMGPRAWCAADDYVVWLANDGFQAARVNNTTTQRWLVGTPVWSFVKNLPTPVKQAAALASDGSRILISFPAATPPVVYSLNTRVGDWEREKNPLWLIYNLPKFGEWEKFPFQIYAPVPLFTGDDPGFFAFPEPQGGGAVYDVRAWPSNAANPYLDLGNPISWFFERKQVEHGSGMAVKRYSEVEIVAPVQTTGQTLTLTITIDDNPNKVYTFTFGLDNGPARLGLPPQVEGNYCTIRISGSHNFKVQIDRIRVWGWVDHRYKSTAQYGTS